MKNDENDCFIWTGATKSNGKEPNYVYGISRNVFYTKPGGDRPKMIKTHRLVYMCSLEKTFLKNEGDDEQIDVSHLCHRSLCVNPGHLALEPHSTNNSRAFCQKTKIYSKMHQPHCI